MKRGVSRGIFSNEAGLGTGSIAHACADTDDPVHQGMFGIFEVFADTIVICTLTALVILCSGIPITYGQDAGAELTILALPLPTELGVHFTADRHVLLCLLHHLAGGFTAQDVWNSPSAAFIKPFMVIYALVSIPGATMDLGLLWSIADTFNGLMSHSQPDCCLPAVRNVIRLTREYFSKNA